MKTPTVYGDDSRVEDPEHQMDQAREIKLQIQREKTARTGLYIACDMCPRRQFGTPTELTVSGWYISVWGGVYCPAHIY